MPAATYPNYGPEVNTILDLARAARRLEKATGTPAGNIVQNLEKAACGWWWSLIDIILDYEDASPLDSGL